MHFPGVDRRGQRKTIAVEDGAPGTFGLDRPGSIRLHLVTLVFDHLNHDQAHDHDHRESDEQGDDRTHPPGRDGFKPASRRPTRQRIALSSSSSNR